MLGCMEGHYITGWYDQFISIGSFVHLLNTLQC